MECLTAKSKLQETYFEVTELSKPKNTKAMKQELINSFLDKVLEFQKHIQEKTDRINFINSKFKEFTWLDNLDEECIGILKNIISLSDGLHHKMIRYYVSLNWALKKGIANESMKNFKIALDDLKEYNQDLEDLFFNLPSDKEFTDKVNELSHIKSIDNE